jgi:hypothetical protein
MIFRSIALVTRSEMNQRDCWRARHKRLSEHRNVTRAVLAVEAKALIASLVSPPAPSPWFIVTLTRVAPSSGLDDDNLRSALKGVRDGVADALGVDDGSPLIEWHYAQRRGRARQYAVEISIVPPMVKPIRASMSAHRVIEPQRELVSVDETAGIVRNADGSVGRLYLGKVGRE